MKIVIFSRNAMLYSTQRLVQACRQRGHYVLVVDHLSCHLVLDQGGPKLYDFQEEIRGFQAVIPRIGSSATSRGEAVVRHVEAMGVYTTLTAEALLLARYKYRSYQALYVAGIPVPKSMMGGAYLDAHRLRQSLGTGPYVLKMTNSTHGSGVIKVDDLEQCMHFIHVMNTAKQSFIIQEFVAESSGEDIRAFVVGDQVVASMKRVAAKGDFRSNLHLGGHAQEVQLSAEEERVAIQAAHSLGLDVAGVDILRSGSGPLILEVNASPGLEGIEGHSGVDIAGHIVSLVEQKSKG